MTALDLKRRQVELMRIQSSRAESELKIEERLDEIKRIEEQISKQKVREDELSAEIAAIQSAKP